MLDAAILVCDSASKLEDRHRDTVVICGSHGGVYPACLAARAGLRAVLLNDAGVGLDRAGLGCLEYGQALGMATATVAHDSARIGDALDMKRRGRISHANQAAGDLGVEPGQTVEEAAARLARAPRWHGEPPAHREGRTVLQGEPGEARVICIDSASLILPEDAGQIVVTGSHGGIMGGRAEMALQVDAKAALFNDAGIGVDEAGVGRLAALDRRRIAAATVDAMTARIGDGLSTYHDGVLSRVDDTARERGAEAGMTARAFVDLFRTHGRG
jgi:hypothetical protein